MIDLIFTVFGGGALLGRYIHDKSADNRYRASSNGHRLWVLELRYKYGVENIEFKQMIKDLKWLKGEFSAPEYKNGTFFEKYRKDLKYILDSEPHDDLPLFHTEFLLALILADRGKLHEDIIHGYWHNFLGGVKDRGVKRRCYEVIERRFNSATGENFKIYTYYHMGYVEYSLQRFGMRGWREWVTKSELKEDRIRMHSTEMSEPELRFRFRYRIGSDFLNIHINEEELAGYRDDLEYIYGNSKKIKKRLRRQMEYLPWLYLAGEHGKIPRIFFTDGWDFDLNNKKSAEILRFLECVQKRFNIYTDKMYHFDDTTLPLYKGRKLTLEFAVYRRGDFVKIFVKGFEDPTMTYTDEIQEEI